MNVSRTCADGTTQPEETLNKSQLYITTAGYKSSYAYEKLMQLLIWQVVHPERAMVLGGTYRIPVLMKLLDKNFIRDLKADGTFNETSFDREYNSIWSGSTADAFFRPEIFDKNRILNQPEYEYSGRSSKKSFYILSADIGRKECSTVICIFKVIPQSDGSTIKSLVNIYDINDEHFETQAIQIKKLFFDYKARRVVIDGNG